MLRGRITVQTCVTKRGRWGLWLRLVQLVVFKIVDSHSQTNTGESPPNYCRYVPSSWKPPIRGCCNDSGVDTKGWRCLPNLPPCSVHVSASSSTCKGFLSLEKTVLCMFYAPLYQACILSFIAGTAHSIVRRWYRMEVFQFTQCKKDGNYSWGQIMLFLGSGEVRSLCFWTDLVNYVYSFPNCPKTPREASQNVSAFESRGTCFSWKHFWGTIKAASWLGCAQALGGRRRSGFCVSLTLKQVLSIPSWVVMMIIIIARFKFHFEGKKAAD